MAYGPAAVGKAPRAGPYSGSPAGGGMSGQRDEDAARMVYVGNLPYSVRWQDLKDHMAKVGQVEFARILTQDGSEYGRSRGVGYVRFSTEAEAQQAVATLNNSDMAGRAILVDVWTGSSSGIGGGKGGQHNGGVVVGRPPTNSGWGYKGGFGGKGGSQGVGGDPRMLVYVGNLPWSVSWRELKDHMSQAGNVEFAKVLTEDGTEYGRSRGTGCVRYSSEAEAQQAIATLAESELMGRKILVDHWTSKTG